MKIFVFLITAKIFNFNFNVSDLSFIPVNDSFYKIELKECLPSQSPIGAPELPYMNVNIVIDKNEKVDSIKVINFEYQDIEGEYLVYPIQPPQVISEEPNGFTPPDSLIYNSSNFYPEKLSEYNSESYIGGYRIANFFIYPLQYLPSQRKLRFYNFIQVKVYTSFSPSQDLPVYRRSEKVQRLWERIIKNIVYNPEDVHPLNILIKDFKENKKFEVTEFPSIYGNTVECVVIIPDSSFLNCVKDFVDFKIKKGCPTVVKTLNWIYENYEGLDKPDKIRNFLKDAYSYWGTMFACLIGDKELIPVRDLWYDRGWYKGLTSSDAYYVGLNGNWNKDGDSIFGERPPQNPQDERDYGPEIFVGRIVVNDTNEFKIFSEKYFSYIKPCSSYQNMALLFGSTNMNGECTLVVRNIKNILTQSGYSVTNAVDYWPDQQNQELKPIVISTMNMGALVFHTYHGGVAVITIDDYPSGSTPFAVWDIPSLQNKDKYNILYSYGCSAGNWTHQHSLAHIWLTAKDKGGVAWLGSTAVNITLSAYYMKYFCEWVFQKNFYQIGIAEWESKSAHLLLWDKDYYLIHQLSGDPEMEIYTDIPMSLFITSPDTITAGNQIFNVFIHHIDGSPVERALVCVYKDDEVYSYGYTGIDGRINFNITPETSGILYVTATKHNYIPNEKTVVVKSTGIPYVRYKTHKIDDDTLGQSDGNSNGKCEAFEKIEIKVVLENVGGFPSTHTYAKLSTTDKYIEILSDSVYYGTIPPQGELEGEPFLIKIRDLPDTSDKHYAILNLKIKYNGIETYDNFSIYLYIPNLKHTSHEVLPFGSYGLIPEVTNYGYGSARDVYAYLHTDYPGVTIIDSIAYLGNINARKRKIANDPFVFSATVPLEEIPFKIKYIDYYGKIWTKNFKIKGISGPDKFKIIHHSENGIKFLWKYTGSVPADIKGYDVYRSLNKEGPYERCNNLLIDTIRIFEDFGILPNTYYYWYVVAIDTFGNKGISKDTLYSLSYFPYQSGFPIDLSPATSLSPLPCIATDIDYSYPGDEIIVWWDNKLYLIRGNGSYAFSIYMHPITLPAVCDIDHDGEKEIICALEGSSKIYIVEKNGNTTQFDYQENTGATGISIGDIQNDGIYEIIILTKNRKIVVLEENGEIIWKSDTFGPPCYGPAIGDIDEDGYLEIVFSSRTQVHGYRIDPSSHSFYSIPGFPVTLPGEIVAPEVLCNPVIADINLGNPGPEIIQVYKYMNYLKEKYICAISNRGRVVNDKQLPYPFNFLTSGYPAVSRYKGDTLQVVITYEASKTHPVGRAISLISYQNTFKIVQQESIPGIPNSPILVNLDDDPESENLFSTFCQYIYGLNQDGSNAYGFPIHFGLNPLVRNACAYGDVDADGDMEVIILVDNGELYVWDTPIKKQSVYEWRYPRHDLFNTGNYHFVIPEYVHTNDKNATAYNSQKKLLIDQNGILHLVYHAWDSVFYAFSEDEGVKWATTLIGKGEYPSISLNNGINCVWRKDKKIYFRRKANNNWQNEEIILSLPYYSNFVSVPCFVSYENYGHVFVEVENYLLGQWQLWYGKFNILNPQEVTWSIIDRRGPPYPFSFSHPSIDVDNYGNLHLIYSINDTIFYRFKEENWSEPEVISEGIGNKNPSISFFRNYIDAVWEKEGEIYHRRKPIGGVWWEIENISNTIGEESTVPVICGSSQVLWQEKLPYGINGEYLIRYSGFDGINWSPYQNVSDMNYNSYNPAICLKLIPPDSGIIYFVYTKGFGNFYEIECKKKRVKVPYLISGEIKEDIELQKEVYITGDVIVPENVNFKILPNTKIYFYPNFDDQKKYNSNLSEIIVFGKLIAEGNLNEKIKFLPLNLEKGSFGGIRFLNSKNSELNYIEIAYSSYGIDINSSDSIKILNSEISENYHGISIKNSKEILIEKCLIKNNKYFLNRILKRGEILKGDTIPFDTLTGIYASNSKIILKNNKMINNFVGFYADGSLILYSYGNYVKDNVWHGYDIAVSKGSNLIFECDTFINNGWYPKEYNLLKRYYIEFAGLSLAHRYYSGISNIEVINCYFKNNCDGIRIGRYGREPFIDDQYNIMIKGNEFDSNFYAVSFHGGRVSHINSILTKNILKNSDSSNIIICAPFDSAKINIGNLENNDTIDDGENHILGSIYSIIDSSYYDIYAQGNLWDYSDSALIDRKIYDDNENPSLSKVNFKYFYRAGEIIKDTILTGEIRIGGDLIIPENVKLTIKEPATIKFAKNFDILKSGNDINKSELIIYGRLKIESENEKIIFTSDGFIKEKGDFYGIIFKKDKKEISGTSENLLFDDQIKNIRIEYSYKGIEFLRENEKLKLMNSEIENSNYGIYFDGKNLEIQNSKITLSDTGIYVLNGKGFIKETEIKENGIGILNKGNSEINFDKSYIMNNKIGIYVDENSRPKLKNGKNYICFNNLYNLYNNTIYDIEAQRNWWGTENEDSIMLLIYDFYDDSTKGKVYFEPIWVPKENISGIQGYEEIKEEFIKLKNTIFRNFTEVEIISFKDAEISLKIYDVSGRKIKEIEENIKTGKNKFKISGLKKGVYFVEVKFNEKLRKFKVIKI